VQELSLQQGGGRLLCAGHLIVLYGTSTHWVTEWEVDLCRGRQSNYRIVAAIKYRWL